MDSDHSSFYDKLCTCGCGQKIPVKNYHKYKGSRIPEYINGHNRAGCKLTEEHKSKFSHRGRTNTAFSRRRSSDVRLGLSLRELGHRSDCSCCVCRAERGEFYHSLEARKKIGDALRGERCYLWRGGLSFLPYPAQFNKNLKNQIFLRDSGTCQICKRNAEQGVKSFHVHHIDYEKKNLDFQNLILLCSSCHSRTNTNRNYWTSSLQRMRALQDGF